MMPGTDLRPESTWTKPSPWCRNPGLWQAPNGAAAEFEVADFLGALTRLLKPELVIETGTHTGATAWEIGSALKANGRGLLVTLEPARALAEEAGRTLAGLPVQVLCLASLDYTPTGPVGLLYCDSALEIRHHEIRRFRPWLAPGAVIAVHDSGPQHPVAGYLAELERAGEIVGINLRTPRGLWIGQAR